MRVALVYGTNRKKATVKVVKWLEETVKAEGHEITVGKPSEFDSLDFDLIIIGSSVYADNVVGEIKDFVKEKSNILSGKKVATFIVCKETKNREPHMDQILCELAEDPINQMFVEGYMVFEKDFGRQESIIKDWIKEVLSTL
ncbi:MAG: flavodoxin domain-containing protein [Candidatus Thorarchaeota archaeon]